MLLEAGQRSMRQRFLLLLRPFLVLAARCDRRISLWRHRAALLLLAREQGRRLVIGRGSRIEPGVTCHFSADASVVIECDAVVRNGAELKVEGRLRVGARSLIGAQSTISVLREVVIGDDCLLAERVSIRDHDHRFNDHDRPIADQGYTIAPVHIGNNVWIGANVVIVKGVRLGDGCVVGANAVVTKSFPARTVLVGVPARPLHSGS